MSVVLSEYDLFLIVNNIKTMKLVVGDINTPYVISKRVDVKSVHVYDGELIVDGDGELVVWGDE